MKKDKLSPKQFYAYMKLDFVHWKSEYALKSIIRKSTLDALVKKGYAEKKTLPAPFSTILSPSYRRTDKSL